MVKQTLSKTEAILGVEIPSQLNRQIEFNFDILKDTPDGIANEMVSEMGLPTHFAKLIALQIYETIQPLLQEHAAAKSDLQHEFVKLQQHIDGALEKITKLYNIENQQASASDLADALKFAFPMLQTKDSKEAFKSMISFANLLKHCKPEPRSTKNHSSPRESAEPIKKPKHKEKKRVSPQKASKSKIELRQNQTTDQKHKQAQQQYKKEQTEYEADYEDRRSI